MASKKTLRFAFLAIALAASSALLTNCAKTDDKSAGSSNPNSFTSIYSKSIVGSSCVECHKPGGSAYASNHSPLDFTTKDTAYSTLTTTFAVGDVVRGGCSSVRIVASGSPTTSFLLGTLSNNYSSTGNFAGVSGCATYPHSSTTTNLSADEISAISAWISAGAKND